MRKFILVFLLIFLTTLGFAEKIAEFPDVVKPESILVDGDNLVVGLEYSVQVYSLKTFKLRTKFTRKGEGPGEVKETPLVYPLPDSFMLFAWGKLLWFSKDGELLKEKKIKNEFIVVKPVKENLVASQEFYDPQGQISTLKYYRLNSKTEIIKDIYTRPNRDTNKSSAGGVFNEFKMITHYLDMCTYDDKIFIADTQKGFFIDVFDYKGNHLYSINKKFEKVKVGEDFKEKIIAELKASRLSRIWPRIKNVVTFYEYFPPIRSFFVADGKIYVTTFKEKDGKHELIVLDLKGNILKRVFLPFKAWRVFKINSRQVDLFTVKDGKLYELIDNEVKELYELHVTDLNKHL